MNSVKSISDDFKPFFDNIMKRIFYMVSIWLKFRQKQKHSYFRGNFNFFLKFWKILWIPL